jgi:Cu/Ag efflux protein CusF
MKIKLLLITALLSVSCSSPSATNNAAAPQAGTALKSSPSPVVSPTPVPTTATPENGDYNGKGIVTKINLELGSVELNHEDIPGLMPPMIMEFYVTDKKLLDGLTVGDKVDFVIRYKDHTEKIVDIKRSK